MGRVCGPAGNRVVDRRNQLQSRVEQPLAERGHSRSIGRRYVLAEVLKVLAIIEDEEGRLVLAGTEKLRTKPRTASQHLPELGLRADQLEENQVCDLRDVNTGVEHVHRDRNVWSLVLDGEAVNQTLGVLGLERDDACKLTLELRIVHVEALGDELRVVLILGEYDGLAKSVTAGYRESAGHHVREHLVDGVFVEEPSVNGRGFDAIRNVAVVAPLECVPLILVVVAQLVVGDAFALKPERDRDRTRRHKEAVAHGIIKGIGIRRYPILQVKQAVRVAGHFVLGRKR